MFLKKLHRKKNGKGHTYWALAESYRTPQGSRHRVVAYLGELKCAERYAGQSQDIQDSHRFLRSFLGRPQAPELVRRSSCLSLLLQFGPVQSVMSNVVVLPNAAVLRTPKVSQSARILPGCFGVGKRGTGVTAPDATERAPPDRGQGALDTRGQACPEGSRRDALVLVHGSCFWSRPIR